MRRSYMQDYKREPDWAPLDEPTVTAPVRPAHPPVPQLRELAGMAEARKWGEAVAQDMSDYIAGRLEWSEVDPGCVLHGPPGTGKTTFGKALAATCGIKLVTTSFGEWQSSAEGHLGTLLTAMTEVFQRARTSAPCIFFIDELDSVPARGSGTSAQYWNVAVNHLLKLLDGIAQMEGVVIVGACNHPDLLDPALVRAGRLDRKIAVALPALEDIPQIIRFHLKTDAATVNDLASVALLCLGMSGADIERMVREARRCARRAKRSLGREDLITVIESAGPRLDPEDLRRVAVHEAGHAVAALRLGISASINVSIVAAGDFAGRTVMPGAKGLFTRTAIGDQLVMLLSGRAAEEAILKSVSSGAGGSEDSDLARATRLAFEAVGTLGLSSQDSLIWYGQSSGDSLRLYPAVAAEINAMLKDAYEKALVLVRTEHVYVDTVARALVLRRALAHHELVAIDAFLIERRTDTGSKRASAKSESAVEACK